jgi:hypothetical protein
MKMNPLQEGVLTKNSAAIGTVTRKMVLGRAEELAIINGDWLHHVSKAERQQAKRELTGEQFSLNGPLMKTHVIHWKSSVTGTIETGTKRFRGARKRRYFDAHQITKI